MKSLVPIRGRSSCHARRPYWSSASQTTGYRSIIESITTVARSSSRSENSTDITVSWSRSNLIWSPYRPHFKEGM